MKYLIKVQPRFKSNPEKDWFEAYADKVVDAVDKYCLYGERSFHITWPCTQAIQESRYNYLISITVKTHVNIDARDLFALINPLQELVSVTVEDARFARKLGNDIYWTNSGVTAYSDNSVYTDPYYEFHVNGRAEYSIRDMDVYIKSHPHMTERELKYFEGTRFVWDTCGSSNNKLKAQTIEEAITEFEEYYFDMLWRGVEQSRLELTEAENKFRDFVNYMRKKK